LLVDWRHDPMPAADDAAARIIPWMASPLRAEFLEAEPHAIPESRDPLAEKRPLHVTMLSRLDESRIRTIPGPMAAPPLGSAPSNTRVASRHSNVRTLL
jgi:hypothetical protein